MPYLTYPSTSSLASSHAGTACITNSFGCTNLTLSLGEKKNWRACKLRCVITLCVTTAQGTAQYILNMLWRICGEVPQHFDSVGSNCLHPASYLRQTNHHDNRIRYEYSVMALWHHYTLLLVSSSWMKMGMRVPDCKAWNIHARWCYLKDHRKLILINQRILNTIDFKSLSRTFIKEGYLIECSSKTSYAACLLL